MMSLHAFDDPLMCKMFPSSRGLSVSYGLTSSQAGLFQITWHSRPSFFSALSRPRKLKKTLIRSSV
ncbi:hypothetical protein RHGRI_014227 [Rhododendron griersonianum]|uniref:Uncharacterized protein n=1 Tax=Rhododendron griersonianum TaxID=479676 RepID=A0AAV6K8S8_9ERIC|nr:hypothetical protein RHGRI_014227 [Rhododendron griersonianum]